MCNPSIILREAVAMSFDLIVTDAVLVTADSGMRVIDRGALAVQDGRIARIGPADSVGRDAAEVIDAGGMILMPGLINTHCHAADSLFRGLVEDLPLEPWLQTVWKAEAAILNRETVRLGATLGLAELLLQGVTTVMDMFWHPSETVAAARDLGIRVSTGGIFFDGPGVDGKDAAEADGRRGGVLRGVLRAPTTCCPAPSPMEPTPVGPETCRRRGDLAADGRARSSPPMRRRRAPSRPT